MGDGYWVMGDGRRAVVDGRWAMDESATGNDNDVDDDAT